MVPFLHYFRFLILLGAVRKFSGLYMALTARRGVHVVIAKSKAAFRSSLIAPPRDVTLAHLSFAQNTIDARHLWRYRSGVDCVCHH